MDIYLYGTASIDNSKDLAVERLRIGQRLASLDPQNLAIYNDEIKDITYRLELQESVENFDQSRVFVNLEGIRRWAKRSISEDFLRYQSLIDAASDTQAALQDVISQLRGSAAIPDALMKQLSGEADKLLLDILVRLADHYLTSPEDGLDVFLSLRIRHGSLSGNIRGPLEEESLLCLKDDSSEDYRPNTTWITRLGIPEQEANGINSAFARFSSEIDASVNYMLREVIQVRSKEKPHAAFELAISLPMVNILKLEISKDTSFDEFLQKVFGVFAASLKNPLDRVKRALQGTLKATVENALDQLRTDLAAYFDARNSPALATAIGHASTNVASAIDRVAHWFSPDPSTETSRQYSIKHLVEMGIKVTTLTHRGFNPNVTMSIAPDMPSMRMDTGAMVVCDVVFTLLDNVFRHSGNPISPNVFVAVCMPDEYQLEFRLRSEVTKGARSAAVEEKLRKIRANLESKLDARSAASEGGSGFYKLKRIGSHTMRSRTTLEFGFESDTAFFVKVGIPTSMEETRDANESIVD